MDSALSWPVKYGSTENPSQFLPPSGVLPSGPTFGPRRTFTKHHQPMKPAVYVLVLTSLGLELLSHIIPPLIRQILIPTRPNMQSRRIRVHKISRSHSIACIMETQTRPSKPRNRTRVAGANIIRRKTTRNVDFLFKRQSIYKLLRFCICIFPNSFASSLRCRKLARSGVSLLGGSYAMDTLQTEPQRGERTKK